MNENKRKAAQIETLVTRTQGMKVITKEKNLTVVRGVETVQQEVRNVGLRSPYIDWFTKDNLSPRRTWTDKELDNKSRQELISSEKRRSSEESIVTDIKLIYAQSKKGLR